MMLQCKHHDVRTTLSIDDDVAGLLKKQMQVSGASLKETVNRYLRLGLAAKPAADRKPFVVTPYSMGPLPPGLSYDRIEELLEAAEGADHK